MQMRGTLALRAGAGLLLSCWCLCGCGSGEPERIDLSGKATFDGQPIVYGSVVFVPDIEAGHKGPTGRARISNGAYDTRAEGGQGVYPGKHLVRVTALPSQPPEQADETVEGPKLEPLFVNWEMKADLTAEEFDIAVPADARGFKPAGGSQTDDGT